MIQTRELIEMCIHPDICTIVLECVQSTTRDWESIAYIGEYETCMSCPSGNVNAALYGACHGGHLELANLMISKGANKFNWGLTGACRDDHLELANLMISKGANNFNSGLYNACRGGHHVLARLMISHGATLCFCGGCLDAHR
jgi:ankyrin repeat protein